MLHLYHCRKTQQRAYFLILTWLLLACNSLYAQQTLLKDINPGTSSSNPSLIASVGNTIYFAATDPTRGTELWRSNGTAAGTVLVKDINPGAGSSGPSELTNLNGVLYFNADDGTNGYALWKSNGTAAGTVRVGAYGSILGKVGNALFLSGNNGLWKSDGTAAGTTPIVDTEGRLQEGLRLYNFIDANGTAYFLLETETTYELWSSDGNTVGMVAVIETKLEGYYDYYVGELTYANGRIYFINWGGRRFNLIGGSLGETDIGDRGNPGGSLTNVDGSLFMVYYNTNLSVIEASAPNEIKAVKGFGVNSFGEGISNLCNVNGTLFFTINNELWKSNKTGSVVLKVRNLSFGQQPQFTSVAGKLYFLAREVGSTYPPRLWVSDGTYLGTKAISEPAPGTPADLTNFQAGSGLMYYSAQTAAQGRELWMHNPAQVPDGSKRINAGGGLYKSSAGLSYSADVNFSGGSVGTFTATVPIANTSDQTLYKTDRWGAFNYNVPLPSGKYNVVLHFAETYWGYLRTGGIGSRKFNVNIEGSRRLTEYDIFAKAGGALRAVKETVTVTVRDGMLNIAFLNGTADQPKVCAIGVIPSKADNRQPVLAALAEQYQGTSGQPLTFTVKATDPDGDALTYSLIPSIGDDPVPPGASINPATGVFSWTPVSAGSYDFQVKVTDNGFPNQSDQATISVNVCAPPPKTDLPVVGSTTFCNVINGSAGPTVTVTVKTTEVGVRYYVTSEKDPYFMTPVQTGNGADLAFTFQIAGQVSAPDTYTFVVKTESYCTNLALTQKAKIVLVPPLIAPAAAGTTISSGQKATLTASSSQAGVGTFRWYSAASAGMLLFTGSTYVTPTLTATSTYYVSAVSSACESARTKVTVTVSSVGAGATFRVNAGGNAFATLDARNFAPDSYFSGGAVSTATTLGIGGTADDYLYQTGRHGTSFSYNFPTGNGNYDVVLHFAETYYGNTAPGGIGSRKFHVNAEGVRKLTDYDVFARAGGALRVAQETFRVNVSDGTLSVAFLKGAADNPAVKAIEVLPAGSALTINSGGGAFTTTAGKRFYADSYYASGSVSGISTGDILNTSDDELYRNSRTGVFSYGLPSGNGTFDVVLHFAETYWGSRATGGIGSRKFNLYAENVKRLSDYDIFAKAGGAMRAVKETVRVTVSDGVLNLLFAKSTADNPAVSAIEVIPVTVAAREASGEGTAAKGWQVQLYPNPVIDELTVRLPFPMAVVQRTVVADAAGAALLVNAHRATTEGNLLVRVGELKRGLYLLHFHTDRGHRVVKFIKQ